MGLYFLCRAIIFSYALRAPVLETRVSRIRLFYNIKIFGNLFKFVEKILSSKDHIVVLIEKNIEGKSSLDDLVPLKNKFKARIKVIIISGEVDSNTIALIYENGADNIVIKPVSQKILIQKIVSTLSPNNTLDELVEGCKAALLHEDMDKANDYADKILEYRPDSAIGLMLKGDIYLYGNNYSKARYYYTKAVLSSRFYLEPLKRLVNFCDVVNDLHQKLVYLKKLDRLSPLNRERKIQIANVLIEVGDNKLAYKYFELAIGIAKRQANEVLSKTYMDVSGSLKEIDFEKSLYYSDKAISVKGRHLSKDDVWMFNDKGIGLRKHGRNEEAIECFRQALKISPHDPAVNYNLGMAYAEEKEVELASGCFDASLKSDPTIVESSANISFNIGLTYYNARRFDDAYKMFALSLSLDPSNEQVRERMENAYKKTSDYDRL